MDIWADLAAPVQSPPRRPRRVCPACLPLLPKKAKWRRFAMCPHRRPGPLAGHGAAKVEGFRATTAAQAEEGEEELQPPGQVIGVRSHRFCLGMGHDGCSPRPYRHGEARRAAQAQAPEVGRPMSSRPAGEGMRSMPWLQARQAPVQVPRVQRQLPAWALHPAMPDLLRMQARCPKG